MAPITEVAGGSRLVVHVVPRASRSEFVGRHGDAVKIRIAAAPVDGAANAELVRLLASRLGVPARQVMVEAGASRRRKVVVIEGVPPGVVALAMGLRD